MLTNERLRMGQYNSAKNEKSVQQCRKLMIFGTAEQ